jgi:hypothetical protein
MPSRSGAVVRLTVDLEYATDPEGRHGHYWRVSLSRVGGAGVEVYARHVDDRDAIVARLLPALDERRIDRDAFVRIVVAIEANLLPQNVWITHRPLGAVASAT